MRTITLTVHVTDDSDENLPNIVAGHLTDLDDLPIHHVTGEWGEEEEIVPTYTTFIRSARNFSELANNPKDVQDTGLTLVEARAACNEWNKNRTAAEIDAGTKMEFESE